MIDMNLYIVLEGTEKKNQMKILYFYGCKNSVYCMACFHYEHSCITCYFSSKSKEKLLEMGKLCKGSLYFSPQQFYLKLLIIYSNKHLN